MKNSEYWRQRFEILEQAQHAKAVTYAKDLSIQYDKYAARVRKDIDGWYARLAVNNNLSFAEARKLLDANELKEFHWSVEDYIKYGEKNALDGSWMKQLENASARVHISRLEDIHTQVRQQIEALSTGEIKDISKLAKSVYKDGYMHTAFEVQKGIGVGWDMNGVNYNMLDKVLAKPWTTDNRTFSNRIWRNKVELNNKLQTELSQAIMRGESPTKLSASIAKQFSVAKHKAQRLVLTESAYFSSLSQKDCFKDLDVEEYEIVATLDSRTSEICREMDGKVCDMKDYEPGVTAPPFHPYCRTVTAPYFDDDEESFTRAARGKDGKTYQVPANMNYKEWERSFVKGGSKKWITSGKAVGGIEMGTQATQLNDKQFFNDVKSKLEDAPDNVKKAWNNVADELKVIETNLDSSVTEYYSLRDKGINFNLAKDSKNRIRQRDGIMIEPPHSTYFHEMFHNMSYVAAEKVGQPNTDFANIFKSKIYTKTFTQLAQDGSKVATTEGYTLTQMIREEATDTFDRLKAQVKASSTTGKITKAEVYEEITKEISQLDIDAQADISDMWSAVTADKVKTVLHHSNPKKYWRTHTVGEEAFAEMGKATVNHPASLKAIKKYFPKSYKIWLEMIDEIGVY